jgi:hypothetical protein
MEEATPRDRYLALYGVQRHVKAVTRPEHSGQRAIKLSTWKVKNASSSENDEKLFHSVSKGHLTVEHCI